MNQEELGRWRELLIEQQVLWRMQQLVNMELERVAGEMREMVEGTWMKRVGESKAENEKMPGKT